jgi:hypothetical protein
VRVANDHRPPAPARRELQPGEPVDAREIRPLWAHVPDDQLSAAVDHDDQRAAAIGPVAHVHSSDGAEAANSSVVRTPTGRTSALIPSA